MGNVNRLLGELTRIGASTRKLANVIGVTDQTIRSWKNGKSEPDEMNLTKLEAMVASVAGGRVNAEFGRNGSGNGNGSNGSSNGKNGHAKPEPEPDEAEKHEPKPPEPIESKPVVTNIVDCWAIGLEKQPLSMKKARDLSDSKPVKHMGNVLRILGIQPLSAPSCIFLDEDNMCATFFALFSPEARKNIIKNHNQGNRDPNADATANIALDMISGNYVLTGETIIFHSDGDLADGQTRIRAALEHPLLAGKPLAAQVTFGVPREAFFAIGGSRTRTNKERLVVAGRTFANVRAKTVTLLNKWDNSTPGFDAIDSSRPQRLTGTGARDLEKHYRTELDEALEFLNGLRWKIKKILPKHVATFVFIFMAKKSLSCARAYMNLVIDGGAPSGSPILAARDELTALAPKKPKKGGKTRVGEQVERLVLGWNAYCAGRNSSHLANKYSKSSKELLSTLAAPMAKVETEAASIVPDEMVAAMIRKAKKNVARQNQLRMDRNSSLNGTFSRTVHRKLENA